MIDVSSVRPFGDAGVLVELGDLGAAHSLSRQVESTTDERLTAVEDVVVGFGTLTVLFDPVRGDLDTVVDALGALAGKGAAGRSAPASRAVGSDDPLEIAVCFDGPDLEELSDTIAMTSAELVESMAGAELQVAFVGFSPGFAYLVGLPPALATVARRPRPRPLVPAGSLAVGGGFAGIYPQASPGGWHLVGRSGAVLFDPRHPPYALLGPDRRVRLCPVDDVAPPVTFEPRRLRAAPGSPALVVEEPGACTLVEDGGRRGVASVGVPRAGAADPVSLRLANRLAGNADGAAALELTVRGPRLRADSDLHLVVVGDPGHRGALQLLVDGHPAPEAEVVPIGAGQRVEVGGVARAVRAVMAVSGGLSVEAQFGSRSSDLLGGVGPGPLQTGDELAVGPPGRPRGRLVFPPAGQTHVLRVLPGPEATSPAGAEQALEAMCASTWWTAPDSNRIGTRLVRHGADDGDGHPPETTTVRVSVEAPSRGMVRGAVQWTPGGELVVLGPDHATVGGYPVPAVVISADLHHLAHLAPGDLVRFEVVDAQEAAAALRRLESSVAGAVEGWFPLRAG